MKINKRQVVSTLALIGLTIGTTASAAEVFRKPMFENLTSTQQEILEEAHELHKQGKDEEARQLIEAAGVELPEPREFRGHGEERKDHMEKFKTLIEQDDFDSFQDLVAGTPMSDIIDTEEKFEALVQAHELRLEDKHEEAREILEDAGIKPFGKNVKNLK